MRMLEITDLDVRYGQIQALKGVTLHVEQGEIVTLLGANGAGKTTLMRTISGLLRPHSGDVQFLGKSIAHTAADRIVRLGISQVPEGRRVFPTLTVMENLILGGYTRPPAETSASVEEVLVLFPRLRERARQLAGTLSGGEQQMLAIGRALMAQPALLLLDEPSLGLAPMVVENIFEIIQQINAEGATVMLVEQNAQMALQISHRGYVLETGKVTLEGPSAGLLADPKVRSAYLGLD